MQNVNIKLKNGKVETMDAVSFSRWVCLVEAFDIIFEKAAQLNLDIESFIKPVAIEHYINERFESVLCDVKYELENGLLN